MTCQASACSSAPELLRTPHCYTRKKHMEEPDDEVEELPQGTGSVAALSGMQDRSCVVACPSRICQEHKRRNAVATVSRPTVVRLAIRFTALRKRKPYLPLTKSL